MPVVNKETVARAKMLIAVSKNDIQGFLTALGEATDGLVGEEKFLQVCEGLGTAMRAKMQIDIDNMPSMFGVQEQEREAWAALCKIRVSGMDAGNVPQEIVDTVKRIRTDESLPAYLRSDAWNQSILYAVNRPNADISELEEILGVIERGEHGITVV